MKRAVAYIGLYLEILSASCRWLSKPRQGRWKSYITRALIATSYLPPQYFPPTQEEIELEKAKQEAELLSFHSAQPETIQTCLRINRKALADVRSGRPDRFVFGCDAPPGPAIPEFKKEI